jgi:hypothetical protein
MTIWLLARVRVAVHIGEASLPVSLPENAKRTLLLAYVASRCGEPVLREKLLEEVFGHGRADEQASPEKLGELFDSHKKLLRREVRATVKKLGASLGIQVPADKIDPFELLPGSRYRLSPWCRVIDLAEIEAQHQIIEAASRDGLLEDHVPEAVKAACDRLLTAYTGDFLEDLLTSYPEEFDPIVSSWVRVPFTRYRDYYFQALWYAAEYERQMGEDEGMGKAPVMDGDQSKRRQHWYQAAQFYRRYALDACKNRCDLKVTFNPTGGGQGGERVVMSERAFRRCLSLYGALSATHLVDEVHTAYIKQMRSISSKGWEPTAKTREVLQRAKDATNAHQWFSSHKKVTPHESSVATTAGQAE